MTSIIVLLTTLKQSEIQRQSSHKFVKICLVTPFFMFVIGKFAFVVMKKLEKP